MTDAPDLDGPTSAYVHIPFCRRRCFYCDFPVSIVGDRPPLARQSGPSQNYGVIAEYLTFLLQEIQSTPSFGPPLKTVFLGGGTPSLLTADQLACILDTLDRRLGITPDAEISIEMDPGTFDLQRLQGYQAAGVNRISLGVQAFQANLLAACGRTHTPDDIHQAVDLLRQVPLANFSLDLISGLPHQTLELWQDSLHRAIALHPTHLSIYDLTVEPMTAFSRWYQAGRAPLPSDEMTAEMYRIAQQTLTTAGYEHYEVSNYALSGYQCRHNRVYWENQPYYGFGMGAASYIGQQRFSRPRTRQAYYAWVEQWVESHGRLEQPTTPRHEILLDTLMLGLRLSEGLRLESLLTQFGEQAVDRILQTIEPYRQQGWVSVSAGGERSPSDSSPRLKLHDPEGFLFSNVVLSSLFQEFSPES